MRKEDLENLKIKDLKHVMTPLKRGRLIKNCVDVGFDSEYTSEDNSAERELLSIQLSLGRGRSKIYYVGKREGISSQELLDHVLQFLNEQDVEPQKHICLITHYGIAELSKINDFYDEYMASGGYKTRPKVAEYNKAIRWEKNFGEVTLHIADLFGQMNTSLEKIGAGLGYEKLKIEADGKNYSYWIANMKELLQKHRDLYEAYAVRDAEVTIEAWNKLKETYAPMNLDPHHYTTYTSLAVASFRRTMTKMPCPTTTEEILSKQRKKDGTWREHVAKKTVFDGDYSARILAARSYWGGNNQAFKLGYMPDMEGTYYDFISLYIIAGILQPLSNEYTRYREISLKEAQEGYEGFCSVKFEFPKETMYPCLPVREDYYHKLMFPLKGTSYCTLVELREALKQGAKINEFRGYGFMPEDNEIEHELKPFLAEMLKKKSTLEAQGKRGTTEYQIEKQKMVGIIGRFGYMKPSHTAEDIARLLHESGLKSEEFRRYGKKKAIRALYTRSEVGGTWHIEWASLVLGKARAMTASIVPQGEACLAISTDGGFWLGDPKFQDSALHKQLATYHSGIRLEGKIDEIWIGGNRRYVAWNQGKLVHAAMMGITMPGRSKEEKLANYVKLIRECLQAGKPTCEEVEFTRFTGLNDFIHDNVPLNSVQAKKKAIKWRHDYKRKTVKEVNLFKDWTDTVPYETVRNAYREVYQVKPVGRPKGIVALTQEQIMAIRSEPKDVPHKKLAEKYGVSVSTIKRVRTSSENVLYYD